MRLLLALSSAAGLVIFWSGVSSGRSLLATRIEPHLNGLDGRPSPIDRPFNLTQRLGRTLARSLPGGRSLRGRLAEAGSPIPVEDFRQQQALWALVGGCAGLILTGRGLVGASPVAPVSAFVPVVLGCLTGYAARDLALSKQVAARRKRVEADLPVALDLLTLAIMAGESVQAAFARVAATLSGDIGDGFRECVADIRAGANTLEALERLPARLPGLAVARLTDSLCTAIERGAPLTETLRAQCDDLREARRRSLLEAGGRREILMMIPVVFLILPVVVVFALYPGLIALDLLVA